MIRLGDVINLKSGESCKVVLKDITEKGFAIYRMRCLTGQWGGREFGLTANEIEANRQ